MAELKQMRRFDNMDNTNNAPTVEGIDNKGYSSQCDLDLPEKLRNEEVKEEKVKLIFTYLLKSVCYLSNVCNTSAIILTTYLGQICLGINMSTMYSRTVLYQNIIFVTL